MDIFRHIKSIGRTTPHPIILEIGANIGQDTPKILECFSDPMYFGFEPDRRNIPRFRKRNPGLELIESAVGSYDGECEFYISEGNKPSGKPFTAGSSIREPTGCKSVHPWIIWKSKDVVPICTLDTFYKEWNLDHVDFIWCDIQGAEIDMINGGKHALAITRYLYTEYSNIELYKDQANFREILTLLPNWRVVEKYDRDVLLKNIILET